MLDGSFCSHLAAVEAAVKYNSIDVYIARDYKRGSCQYYAILDHERRHVGVFNDTLLEFAPRMEWQLREAANTMEAIHNRDRHKAVARFQERLERAMQPLFTEFNRVLASRNSALDTEENYREEMKNCLSW